MVRTSLSSGTLVSVSGSGVSSAAQRIGKAAFFAPETRTSPCSGTPPSIASLSTLGGGQRLHRQRVDFGAHAIAQRAIDELVALDARESFEGRAHDQRLEMLAVAVYRDVLAGESCLDGALDVFGSRHVSRGRAAPTD